MLASAKQAWRQKLTGLNKLFAFVPEEGPLLTGKFIANTRDDQIGQRVNVIIISGLKTS